LCRACGIISFLSVPTDPLPTIRIERAPTIGRPLGAPEWIAVLERRLGHRYEPGKPGPKPRADRETKREPRLLGKLK